MALLANQVYYDVYDGYGNLILQDGGPIFSTTTATEFGYGCKLHGVDRHLVTTRNQTTGAQSAQLEAIVNPITGATSTISSGSLGTLNAYGLARDDKAPGPVDYSAFHFIDRDTAPETLYRLTLDGTTFYADGFTTIDSSRNLCNHPCFLEKALACAAEGVFGFETTCLLSNEGGAAGGIYYTVFQPTTRTPQPVGGIAWNGKDLGIVYADAAVTPTQYTLDLLFLGQASSSGGIRHTLATRTTAGNPFPGDSDPDSDGLLGLVDLDWDGRNWYVWYNCEVDIGA